MTRRILTVWCPQWPVVAAGRHDEVAVVLAANRVVARSAAAAASGIRVGSRRREAQRCCPDVVLVDHDPDRDARSFEPVVRAVAAFVPRTDVVTPGMLCLDARGPARYFGGEEEMARQVADAVERAAPGARAVVGIADGHFASAIASQQATPSCPMIVAAGGSPAFLAPLPVRWLAVAAGRDAEAASGGPSDLAELVDLLVRLGLTRLGAVAAMAQRDLLARFGAIGVLAHRLASGGDERPPGGAEPPPEWDVTVVFDEPVDSVQPVVFRAKTLADRLAATLAANGQVCTRLVVVAETDHGERSERAWYLATGLGAAAMVERVRWQLDGWVAQRGAVSAGIVLLRLSPDEIHSDGGEQAGLWGGRSDADGRAHHAITRLTGMVGSDSVLVPEWRGGRLPGERYRWVPALTVDLGRPQDRRRDEEAGPWPGALPTPSPPVVLTEPREVEVVDASGAAVRVTGRGVVSATPATVAGRDVVAWAGPWPVEQRWWSPEQHRRLARFQVVLDDGAAQVLAVEQQRWWLVATYR
ncbi:MAG: DNA polymerase Y family protein [Actinomycetota bacterium]|nr:DNA polymerase Y family protein [Actinomycetota bacterium]